MSDQHENVLPAAIRKQVEQADAIIAQMNAQAPDEPEEVQEQQEAAPEPKAEPKPKPEAKPEAKPDFEHKYSVLKGKYDAEVPRLTADLRESNQQVRRLEDQLRKLEMTVATMQEVNKKPDKAADTENLITQDEIDQFGPDLIDLVNRVARQAVAPYVDKKVGEVAQNVKQVGESVASQQKLVAQSAREKLYERLDSAIGDWRDINRRPEFVGWLSEVDDFSGQPRGVLLRAAFERNDADRVIKFFKGFQKENAVETSDPEADAPANQQATPKQESQQSLETLVAPGTPKTGSTGAQEGSGKGRIWTRKQISEFYAQKNEFIKAYPNKDLPKRMVEIERDLFDAQRENRIR